MSRSAIYIIAMGLVSTAIIAVMIFGIGTAFSVMFLGGLSDGNMKLVFWSCLVALASIYLIQQSLKSCDWLGRWKVGRR